MLIINMVKFSQIRDAAVKKLSLLSQTETVII